jgi:hypothetical protein
VQSDDPTILAQGKTLEFRRYALHIPSQTREHTPLAPGQIAAFGAASRDIGLDQVSRATGFWTLETGVLQQEPLRIAWSDAPVEETALRALVLRILTESNQEAVAIEVAGRVVVVRD